MAHKGAFSYLTWLLSGRDCHRGAAGFEQLGYEVSSGQHDAVGVERADLGVNGDCLAIGAAGIELDPQGVGRELRAAAEALRLREHQLRSLDRLEQPLRRIVGPLPLPQAQARLQL